MRERERDLLPVLSSCSLIVMLSIVMSSLFSSRRDKILIIWDLQDLVFE